MPKQTTAPRFLRISEVLQMTGMGKTFIYDRMKEGTFPKQIQLGSRSVVWNEQEVIKWMEDRMASRCPPQVGGPKYQQNSPKAGHSRVLCLFLCLKSSVI